MGQLSDGNFRKEPVPYLVVLLIGRAFITPTLIFCQWNPWPFPPRL
jgi:hypothetical protein